MKTGWNGENVCGKGWREKKTTEWWGFKDDGAGAARDGGWVINTESARWQMSCGWVAAEHRSFSTAIPRQTGTRLKNQISRGRCNPAPVFSLFLIKEGNTRVPMSSSVGGGHPGTLSEAALFPPVFVRADWISGTERRWMLFIIAQIRQSGRRGEQTGVTLWRR